MKNKNQIKSTPVDSARISLEQKLKFVISFFAFCFQLALFLCRSSALPLKMRFCLMNVLETGQLFQTGEKKKEDASAVMISIFERQQRLLFCYQRDEESTRWLYKLTDWLKTISTVQ